MFVKQLLRSIGLSVLLLSLTQLFRTKTVSGKVSDQDAGPLGESLLLRKARVLVQVQRSTALSR